MDAVLKNLVRVGRVSSTDPEQATVRVVFADRQNLVSYDLPVIVRQSLRNKDYWMPHVGEQVVCLFLPNGNAQGFILGSFYSTNDRPPVNTGEKRCVQFEDGTHLEYDSSNHTLTIIAQGPIHVVGQVTVAGDVIADGISLKNHAHGGVRSGGDTSGVPV